MNRLNMPTLKCSKCNTVVTVDNLNDLHYGCEKKKCPMKKEKAHSAACEILEIDPQDIHPIASGSVAPNEVKDSSYSHQTNNHHMMDYPDYIG